MSEKGVPKSAEAIRNWAQDQFVVVTGMEEAAPSRIDTQLRMQSAMAELLQMRLLAEIAAQLAEANELTRDKLIFDVSLVERGKKLCDFIAMHYESGSENGKRLYALSQSLSDAIDDRYART